eukprot:scaffold8057_cov277-Pinguiococcus_pyrenoidosus.AAC.2
MGSIAPLERSVACQGSNTEEKRLTNRAELGPQDVLVHGVLGLDAVGKHQRDEEVGQENRAHEVDQPRRDQEALRQTANERDGRGNERAVLFPRGQVAIEPVEDAQARVLIPSDAHHDARQRRKGQVHVHQIRRPKRVDRHQDDVGDEQRRSHHVEEDARISAQRSCSLRDGEVVAERAEALDAPGNEAHFLLRVRTPAHPVRLDVAAHAALDHRALKGLGGDMLDEVAHATGLRDAHALVQAVLKAALIRAHDFLLAPDAHRIQTPIRSDQKLLADQQRVHGADLRTAGRIRHEERLHAAARVVVLRRESCGALLPRQIWVHHHKGDATEPKVDAFQWLRLGNCLPRPGS